MLCQYLGCQYSARNTLKIGERCLVYVAISWLFYFGFLDCWLPAKSEVATTDNKKEYERGKKKYQQLLKKQETLLRGKEVDIIMQVT